MELKKYKLRVKVKFFVNITTNTKLSNELLCRKDCKEVQKYIHFWKDLIGDWVPIINNNYVV